MIKSKQKSSGDSAEPLSIENVILVDFQYSCWTSPTIDLTYFLNTSLQKSLRPDRFDELIGFYHTHLSSCLKRLDYKKSIPNLDEFKKQYRDKSFYGTNLFFESISISNLPFFNTFLAFRFRFHCIMHNLPIDDK